MVFQTSMSKLEKWVEKQWNTPVRVWPGKVSLWSKYLKLIFLLTLPLSILILLSIRTLSILFVVIFLIIFGSIFAIKNWIKGIWKGE